MFVVPDRQVTKAGGIDSLESTHWLLKILNIPSLLTQEHSRCFAKSSDFFEHVLMKGNCNV
jgi:hypothetical protein